MNDRPLPRVRQYAEQRGIDYDQAMIGLFEKNERMAKMMDSAVHVPLVGGVGLDAALGLVPVVGDIAGKIFAISIIANASQMGAPKPMVTKMVRNSVADLLIGFIPVVGDLFDVFFRANQRNIGMLRSHLEQQGVVLRASPFPRGALRGGATRSI